jgi:hypothetical protein
MITEFIAVTGLIAILLYAVTGYVAVLKSEMKKQNTLHSDIMNVFFYGQECSGKYKCSNGNIGPVYIQKNNDPFLGKRRKKPDAVFEKLFSRIQEEAEKDNGR